MPLRKIQEGVYEADHFTGAIRLVVVHQLPLEEQNAMLHLFAAGEEMVRYGQKHYRPRSWQTSTFLDQLFDRYEEEGTPMPFAKEQFIREAKEKMAKDPDLVEVMVKAPAAIDRVLKAAPIEKCLEGISAEDLRKLSPERRAESMRDLQAEE